MARGKTLLQLLSSLRAETRVSQSAAHNAQARDSQVERLQRVQEWLWEDFDWPHLRVERFVPLQAGQRFYDLASAVDATGAVKADLILDRIEKVEVRYAGEYTPLCPGIDACHYALHDSELDIRSWPVERWRIFEGEQIEIWPVPSENADAGSRDGYVKITGIRKLRPLVEDGAVADLDDRLIVLYAAGETLAGSGAKDAQLKLEQASTRYARLRSGLSPRKKISMFGVGRSGEHGRALRGPPLVHYRIVSGS